MFGDRSQVSLEARQQLRCIRTRRNGKEDQSGTIKSTNRTRLSYFTIDVGLINIKLAIS
jgi:hypothetical protein